MKYWLAALALTSSSLACAQEVEPADESASAEAEYRELREDIWQWMLDQNPYVASSTGDRRGDGKLFDLSLEAFELWAADSRVFLERLEAIDVAAMPEDLRVDHAVQVASISDNVASAEFDQSRYIVFSNRGGWFSTVGALAYSSAFFDASDYESYIARMEAYPTMNAQGIARSRIAVERGFTLPCEPMEGLMDRIKSRIFDSAEESPLWQPMTQRPRSVDDAEWEALHTRARAAIEDRVFPAYTEFTEWYESEYEPNCRRDTFGVMGMPNGEEYYAYQVRSFTTTDMTPDEVHNLGLSEVERIRSEMMEVVAEAGYDSREAYIEHLRTDPQYYAKTPEELIAAASSLAKEVDGWMPKLFGNLPRQPYTVQPIPAAQAPGNTTAYYEPGSLRAGQPGVYRVNTTELDQRPLWELPALGLHEGVPGHHQQLAIQQEIEIHPLRANSTFFTAFVEGWGLYSERLGIDMGLYDTPAKRMGQLSYEMWRATRLVVDTGIHSRDWSKQRAVDFMLNNTALTPGNVDAEVNRYSTWPGQALGYKIGELKISELRERAETALGSDFDVRAFHDAVLENGAVPLNVLDAHIDRWIAAELAELGASGRIQITRVIPAKAEVMIRAEKQSNSSFEFLPERE